MSIGQARRRRIKQVKVNNLTVGATGHSEYQRGVTGARYLCNGCHQYFYDNRDLTYRHDLLCPHCLVSHYSEAPSDGDASGARPDSERRNTKKTYSLVSFCDEIFKRQA